MARNASGTYTLPAGNPVVSGTLIDATWANNTLADLGNEMTDSLSRSGEGAMLAPLRITDGVQATPALAFSNEPSSGLYRGGSNEWWAVAAGVQNLRFTNTGLTTRAAAGAVGTPSLAAFNDTDTGIYFPGANQLAIATGGVGALWVDSSQNVGIGTASPGYKLDVRGVTASGNGTITTGFSYDTRGLVGTFSNHSLGFLTNGAVVGTWDTSGNLGLGVTPSASWRTDATLAVLEVKSAGSAIWNAGARNFNFSNNSYWVTGGSFQYASTGAAAWYQQTGGEHRFYNAASGTAGNTISFTQAMTLDASGNLGVGTTIPSYRLDVNRASYGVTAAFRSNDGTNNPRLIIYGTSSGTVLQNTYSANAGNLIFAVGGAEGSGTEVARVNDSGDFGIGTNGNPSCRLDVRGQETTNYNTARFFNGVDNQSLDVLCGRELTNGTPAGVASSLVMTLRSSGSSAGLLAFATGNNERGRFDINGNFGIGTASPGQKLEVAGNQRFTGSQVGTKIENRNTGINVSTATTILDEAGAHGRVVIVNGANGGDRFCDLVFCSTAENPTVISSFTAFGTPTARTYTRNGSALELAMASGTYVVNALALGY